MPSQLMLAVKEKLLEDSVRLGRDILKCSGPRKLMLK